jgi:signal transduction histidine kinase
VAEALHEGIAQDLFAAQLGLKRLAALPDDSEPRQRIRTELAELIERCIESLRAIANDLRPDALAHLNLASALRDQAQRIGRRTGLQVEVRDAAALPPLPESTRIVLFRAAQEAMASVVQHAAANHVLVALSADELQVRLEVSSDGVGLDEAALAGAEALGLLVMRERLEALGGGLDIRSGQPAGTTVVAHLPHAAA